KRLGERCRAMRPNNRTSQNDATATSARPGVFELRDGAAARRAPRNGVAIADGPVTRLLRVELLGRVVQGSRPERSGPSHAAASRRALGETSEVLPFAVHQ